MREFIGYMKGVNLGGWLSQCVHTKEHYDTFITKDDFKNLSGWNLDHLRIPVDYNLFELENGFDYIDNAIMWCKEYGLNMILDLHKTYGYSFDAGEKEFGFFENEEYQEKFYALWEELAKRYSKHNQMLAFELLNEVTDKEFCDTWNRIATKCIEKIRSISKDVKILIGGYYNNSACAVKDLPDFEDENVVYNFHCYEPLKFTHQGAQWVPNMPADFKMTYQESQTSVEYFEELFKETIEIADKRGKQLYCGEYGVIETVNVEDAAKWHNDIHAVFNKYGIGRAVWSYKQMDFDLEGEKRAKLRELIINA